MFSHFRASSCLLRPVTSPGAPKPARWAVWSTQRNTARTRELAKLLATMCKIEASRFHCFICLQFTRRVTLRCMATCAKPTWNHSCALPRTYLRNTSHSVPIAVMERSRAPLHAFACFSLHLALGSVSLPSWLLVQQHFCLESLTWNSCDRHERTCGTHASLLELRWLTVSALYVHCVPCELCT